MEARRWWATVENNPPVPYSPAEPLPGFVVILGLWYSNRIAEFLTLWIFPKWNDWAFIVVVGLFFSKSTEWRARRLEKKLWNGRKKMTCPFYWLESVVVVTLCDYSPAACPSASINIPRGQGVVRPFDQFQLRFFLFFFSSSVLPFVFILFIYLFMFDVLCSLLLLLLPFVSYSPAVLHSISLS